MVKRAKFPLSKLFKKTAQIKTPHLLYALLLISFFLLGYLLARVQYLEQGRSNVQKSTAEQIPDQSSQPQRKVNVAGGHLPTLGDKNARVTIIEFADFQCPFCKRFFDQTLPSIKSNYVKTGKVKVYFRHFAFLGPESSWAGEASECANEQGKFWEYHDYLFSHQQGENQGAFSKDNLKKFAIELGLNTTKFNQCLEQELYKDKVEQDSNDGRVAGVSGTPTVFVNGQMVVGAQPYAAFKTIIDQELQK